MFSWVRSDGTEVTYDSATDLVTENGVTRAPNDTERAIIGSLSVPPPPPPPTPEQTVLQQLQVALSALRGAVEDSTVTAGEAQAATALVLPALLAYSALPKESVTSELSHEADRVFSRSLQALLVLGGQTATRLAEVNAAMLQLSARLTALEETP